MWRDVDLRPTGKVNVIIHYVVVVVVVVVLDVNMSAGVDKVGRDERGRLSC